MQKSNAPTKLTVAFASGTGAGPVNNVPLTPGATPGTASYQTGFTSVNMEPIASGGIPPFGADFNGLHKAATTAQIWQQSGFTWTFDSTFAGDANIGGYPAQSVLMMGSGNGLWINKTDNNTTNPDATGSSGWLGLPAAGSYAISTTGGTTTPDPSVLGVTILIVVGALTSNATLVLPLTAGSHWIVANATTGGFTLTVQGASGAGASVPQGSALTVYTDGAGYFTVSANISGEYLPIDGTAVAATKLATARAFSITGFATAAAINFDGTGNVTFNVTALNVAGALGYPPANDANVVHKTGDETVAGVKTVTGSIQTTTAGATQGYVALVPANSAGMTGTLQFFNTAGTRLGYFGFSMGSSGNDVVVTPELGSFGILGNGYATGNFQANGITSTAGVSGITGTFSGAITATTANFTGSDRRLKRNIRKIAPRPLHRSVKFVGYTLKESGWYGLGATAQNAERYAPEHVGTFEKDGKIYLSLNYAGMAYEQAIWDGQEIDRLTKRIAKLERVLDRARIEPRKRGFVRRLLEAIW